MNNSQDYSNSKAPAAPDQELLRQLMPQLGLEATEPKKRYRNQMWRRYLLPKVAGVCVLAAALAYLAWYAFTPAHVHNMRVSEDTGRVAVEFDVDKVLLLESVTAKLDGQPVDVQYETVGSYKIDLDKNGALSISARTFTGAQTDTEMPVDAVDEDPPHISDHQLTGEEMTINFTDSGSGIDWSTLQATVVSTGESFEIPEVDEQASCIRFPFPDDSIRITLSDKKGNPLAVILELVHEDEADTPAEAAGGPRGRDDAISE